MEDHRLDLNPELPVGPELGALDVVERLDLEIGRGLPYDVRLPDTAPHRNGPLIPALRLPVRGDDRLRRQVLAVLDVIVDEDLREEETESCRRSRQGSAPPSPCRRPTFSPVSTGTSFSWLLGEGRTGPEQTCRRGKD